MSANDTPTRFTDEDLSELKKGLDIDKEFHANAFWQERDKAYALIARLESAERAVDEASCLLDHPAFTVGTRSQELLPQGMAARAKSAREAVDAWVKVAGKYQ